MGQDVSAQLEKHVEFLRRLAGELVRHGEDPDDIVQDALLIQMNQGPDHEDKRGAWIAGVVRNLARSRRRADANRRHRELGYAQSKSSEALPAPQAEHREQVQLISRALTSLDDRQYEALYYRYFDGRMPREIASTLDLPAATVKRRIERALKNIRDHLSRNDVDWRHGMALLMASPAGEVGFKLSLKGLFVGAIAMKKTVVAAGTLIIIALVALRISSAPEQELDVPVNEESDSEFVEARRPQSQQPGTSDLAPPQIGEQLEAKTPRDLARDSGPLLRLTLDGVTEEEARLTRIKVSGLDKVREPLPFHFSRSWRCRGVTSVFDLGPLFARIAKSPTFGQRLEAFEVKVCHPSRLIETVQVPLSGVVEHEEGRIYEVRVTLKPGTPHLFWPESTLAVRDARTREHLENIELRFVPTAFMGLMQIPGTEPIFTSLGDGLSSPIALLGGRETQAPDNMAGGLALVPKKSQAPQLIELVQPEVTDRGVMVYARAPGYAWGRIVLDVSKGATRELLLVPSATLKVLLTNVPLDHYSALETSATIQVTRISPGGDRIREYSQNLDEVYESDGLVLEDLVPGDYIVTVELGQWTWREQPVLANAEFTMKAGEPYVLALALSDPPELPERSLLAGTISLPRFAGEKALRLQVYHQNNKNGKADAELSIADMEHVGGALPTWAFRFPDLPVGLYQIQLRPLMKRWMVELPSGGREDLKLEIPKLAEVLVEIVDAQTGKRIPIEKLHFNHQEEVPGLLRRGWDTATLEEPGRFRFWAPPGSASIWPSIPAGLNYSRQWLDLRLVAELQEKNFELDPRYAIRFEFRDDGSALPMDDQVGVFVSRDIRAIGHEGRVTRDGMQTDMHVDVSTPGLYEISFKSLDTGRYHPIPPRRVEVRGDEPTVVIVDLLRKQ